jgi:chromate transporter
MEQSHKPSFGEAFKVWAKIGCVNFGGPAGQIALMHRVVVEERKWVSEAQFLHALNYCMLLPGPEAQQLATYIGWLMHGTRGGLAAGGLFILPGLVVIWCLSTLYAAFHATDWLTSLFFGVKCAVLAIVVEALLRIARRALKTRALMAVAWAAFLALFLFHAPFPAVIIAAGLIGAFGRHLYPAAFPTNAPDGAADAMANGVQAARHRPIRIAGIGLALWLGPVILVVAWLGGDNLFAQLGIFFSKMAVVTFGGAYAVLSYVAQQAVETYHWLSPQNMIDGLALAETTPGPLILVLSYVGYLAGYAHPGDLQPMLAGTLGLLFVTYVTFTPSFLWIFLGAPYVERLRGLERLGAAMSAITAAVVGVIGNLALWFGLHVLFRRTGDVAWGPFRVTLPDPASIDLLSCALAAMAAIALLRLRIGMIPVLGGSALIGLAIYAARQLFTI